MAKQAAKKLTQDEKRKKVETILKCRDAGKRKYICAGQLMDELIAGGMKAGEKVEISGGRTVTLVDVFKQRNKSYKNVTVDRFTLDVSENVD